MENYGKVKRNDAVGFSRLSAMHAQDFGMASGRTAKGNGRSTSGISAFNVMEKWSNKDA